MSSNGKTTVEAENAQLDHGKRTCAGGTKERVRAFKRVVVLALASFVCASVAHAAIPASERAVLQNIYTYTDGDNWFPLASVGWNGATGTECTWQGITCNAEGTTVIAIRLAGSSLNGSLPALNALTQLEVFDVRDAAPGGFATGNRIRGSIPQLGSLTKLREFRAGNNAMTGVIPSLAGLNDLRIFECYLCGLSGPIPALTGLIQLETFDVSWNQLSGSLPALTGLTKLAYLNVGENHLGGSLPEFTGLQSLISFYAIENLFSGSVPDLVDLPNLQTFAVSGQLDGQIGALRNLPRLVELDLSGNLLTGSIPQFDRTPRLQRVFLGRNRLTGVVPDLSQLTDLNRFYIGYNLLEGTLPNAPAALIANATPDYPSAQLCPNRLMPASTPPSGADAEWNIATQMAPWSQDCLPSPRWKTAIYIRSNLDPILVGQSATLTATVWGMNPTGTVTFVAKNGMPGGSQPIVTLCENVSLVGSTATCMVDDLPASDSTYRITGIYSGDALNESINRDIDFYAQFLSVQFALPVLTTTANPAQINEPVDIVATAGLGDDDLAPMFFYDGDTLLCGNVPVHEGVGRMVGHCLARFTSVGPHSLLVLRSDFSLYVGGHGLVPLIQNVVTASPFDANQFGLNGSWYNPVTSGQGLQLQVYPNHVGEGLATLTGNWNTYDASGNQQWYPLQGDLSQAHGATFSMVIGQSIGGNFNAAPMVQATAIGSATMTIHDCTHATFAFSFADGRSGTIPYVRLTDPTACSTAIPALPPGNPPEHYNDLLHSGIWFDPATSGQGLMVEIVPSMTTFFAAWSTYAPQGVASNEPTRQRWFSLQDNHYTPGDLSLNDVPIILTTGGRFNEPSAVEIRQVGSADIDFTSCSTMTLHYTFTDGEFSGRSGRIDEQAIVPHPDCR